MNFHGLLKTQFKNSLCLENTFIPSIGQQPQWLL